MQGVWSSDVPRLLEASGLSSEVRLTTLLHCGVLLCPRVASASTLIVLVNLKRVVSISHSLNARDHVGITS